MANSINFNGNFINLYFECIVSDLLTYGKYKATKCENFMGMNGINTVIDKAIINIYEYDTAEIRDDVFDKLVAMKSQGNFTGTLTKE